MTKFPMLPMRTICLAFCCGFLLGAPAIGEEPKSKPVESRDAPQAVSSGRPLFDGKTLENWKITDFGGQGDVRVESGAIVMERGEPLSGITWSGGPLPKVNYEISLEAMKTDGNDFFCGITFPVKDSHCSLILGGWGGALSGLSSIDGFDASENETTSFHSYEKNKWYQVKVRVTDTEIEAWLDKERITSVNYAGRKVSLRIEVEICKPLSISNFQTTSRIKNIRLQEIKPADEKPAK